MTRPIILALLASPAMACGDGGCTPPPPPPPPVVIPDIDRDRDPVPFVPAYEPCCTRDGTMVVDKPILGLLRHDRYCTRLQQSHPDRIRACDESKVRE